MVQRLERLCNAAACASTRLDASSLFVDIGSGVGKLVTALALLTPARALGVELIEARAAAASAALDEAVAQGSVTEPEVRRLSLVHADATTTGVLPESTTHAFLPNLCFPDSLTATLLAALARMPGLRCIITIKKLHQPDLDGLPSSATCQLQLIQVHRVKMTWDDAAKMYFYGCRAV